MHKAAIGLLAFLSCLSILGCSNRPSQKLTTVDVTPIKKLLIRGFCNEIYWSDLGKQILGAQLPLEIKSEGDTFYAWIDSVIIIPSQTTSRFFSGRVKDGVLLGGGGYNPGLIPQVPGHQRERHHFESGIIIKDVLSIPSDCTPKFQSSEVKEAMIQRILETMKKRLKKEMGSQQHSISFKLVIADFGVDDYGTMLILDDPKEFEIYYVTFRNAQDYSDEYRRWGGYPVWRYEMSGTGITVSDKLEDKRRLASKIRMIGIERVIKLYGKLWPQVNETRKHGARP